MPNYHAISLERHAQKFIRHQSSFSFVASDSVIPLAATELPKAMLTLPIAFVRQGDGFVPSAVLSLQPGVNLFVTVEGRWVGEYVPASYRGYPFALAPTDDGKHVLCVDEDSGLVDDGPAGTAIFNETGEPAQVILDVFNFLTRIEQSRRATGVACAALQKHGLIQPWSLTGKSETGEIRVEGLFQVDEMALNGLSGDALQELAQGGALMVAYCQLLSMQHWSVLGQLAETRAKAAEQASAAQQAKSAPLETADDFFNKNGIIRFEGLL